MSDDYDLSARSMRAVRQLAGEVRLLKRQVRNQGRGLKVAPGGRLVMFPPQPPTNPGDPLDPVDPSVDPGGRPIIVIGPNRYGGWGIETEGGDTPVAPSTPLVATLPEGATVTWDGNDDAGDNAWSPFLSHVSVRMTTEPVEPDIEVVEVARLPAGKGIDYGGAVTVAQPSDVTTYVHLVAVLASGLESAPSVEAEVVSVPVVPSTDGSPPASSPTPVVQGGIESVYAFWTATANADPVTYDLYAGASAPVPVDSGHFIGSTTGTVFSAAPAPAGSYFLRIVARDADGSATGGTSVPYTVLPGVDLGPLEDDLTALEARFPITTPDLAALAVTAAKLGDGSVLTAKLADAAVATAKIAGGAVTSTELGTGAVIAAKLAANAVTTGAILDDAINAAKIATGAVGSGELAAGAVIAGKITAGAIVAADIAADTITASQIAANAITTSELNALAVTAAKIAADTITATQIAANAIAASELAANSVVAGKIAAGTIVAADIAADTITAGNLAANSVNTSELVALAVTAGKIAVGTITANEIAANAVDTNQLNALAVTAAKIAANTITANKIAAGVITANEIAALTITAALIAANTITAAKIAAGTITATEIAANTITTGKLAATAIDGMTITGALIRTASSGRRLELQSSADNALTFYSGNASETGPGTVSAQDATFGGLTQFGVRLRSPSITVSAVVYQPYIELWARNNSGVGGAVINLIGATTIGIGDVATPTAAIQLNATQVTASGALKVTGLLNDADNVQVRGTRIQNVTGITNASGVVAVSFGMTFPSAPAVVAIGANGETVNIPANQISTVGFNCECRSALTYGLIASGAVRICYVASVAH